MRKKIQCWVCLLGFSLISVASAAHLPWNGVSWKQVAKAPAEQPDTIEKKSPKDADTKSDADDKDIARFTNAVALIKDFYVERVGDKLLLENAIRGMVGGLDPHSEYLDKEAYKALMMATSGEFGGIGVEVTPEFGILKVVTPIDDTPAARAGIHSGDYLIAIDGKMISEMPLQEAVEKMRGKAGTELVLTVLRKGEKSPLVFRIYRQAIRITSVKYKSLENQVGYIRITQFQEPTGKLLKNAISDLRAKNKGKLQGLILDLRNNPGGLLEMAVEVVNDFLDSNKLQSFDKKIVYTQGRLTEAQYSARSTGHDLLEGVPLVVLINSGSASASEIVAGALQDYRRALVVGTPSFGKGSVQTVIPLDKEHAIKLTTALYHTPAGRVIQNVGIFPDVTVEPLKVVHEKSEEDLSMLEPIKEYQLKNHLPNRQTGEMLEGVSQTDAVLAAEDFQLYTAIKVLKAMRYLTKK